METFIVKSWEKIIIALKNISLFNVITNIFPSAKGYGFVETWVIANFFASIILLCISSVSNIRWWEIIILIYASSRIFEIIIYQIYVLLFSKTLGGYRRLFILLISNALEILIWFAIFYRNFDYLFETKYIQLNSFLGSIYYSLVTMSTLGYGDIVPKNYYALYITIPQTLIGIFIALIILARFISLIPKPKTLDEIEKQKNE